MTEYVTKDSGVRQEFGTGAVRDTQEGKGRYDLLPPAAIRRLALVYERGAQKYAARNWEKGIPCSRMMSSALRHLFQYMEGLRDEDHLGHALFNICGIMHFEDAYALALRIHDGQEEKRLHLLMDLPFQAGENFQVDNADTAK